MTEKPESKPETGDRVRLERKVGRVIEWVFSAPNMEWNLMVKQGRRKARTIATVWSNGTWHTWDQNGIGGWNSIEESVALARIQAAGCAIEQGFAR